MQVIHIIHNYIKLFTLKRFGKSANSTLKHFGFSAETLRHSIYACSYLYKKPVVGSNHLWITFFVESIKLIKIVAVIIPFSVFITGCCPTVHIPVTTQHPLGVIQRPDSKIHPAAFYVCGNAQYPCNTKINTQQQKFTVYK